LFFLAHLYTPLFLPPSSSLPTHSPASLYSSIFSGALLGLPHPLLVDRPELLLRLISCNMADASTNSVPPKCAKCSKDKSDSGQGLKRCGRCKLAHYCSRECQKADWKNHKTLCGSTGDSPSPPSTLSPSTSTTPPQHLFSIDRPFHRLQSRTWLHDRPEHDVFVLLIDAYRLRMRDKICV
jgi:hypothetical protein